METSRVTAGRGLSWIKQGLGLVMDRPVVWIGGTAAALGLSLVLNFIPVIGWLLNQVLSLGAGIFFLSYASKQKQELEFDIDETWAEIKGRVPRIIAVMLLSSALAFACLLPVIATLLVVGGLEYLSSGQFPKDFSTGSIVAIGISGLVAAIGFYFVLAATSFSTPLILLQNRSMRQALSLSYKAVTRNVAPLFIYFMLLALLLFVCIIPFGLGLLLGLPAMTASFYLAYEDLLGRQDRL